MFLSPSRPSSRTNCRIYFRVKIASCWVSSMGAKHKQRKIVLLILRLPNNRSQLLFVTRKGRGPIEISTCRFYCLPNNWTVFASSLLPKLVMSCNIHVFTNNVKHLLLVILGIKWLIYMYNFSPKFSQLSARFYFEAILISTSIDYIIIQQLQGLGGVLINYRNWQVTGAI